ncbi:addiction module protein [Zavarzinella formosa]|uniref:addiction module protein n=1 Tax=Zavarzinella formosa TaxID=360055 RepID=UPI0003639E6B|nr:addiction module protein [Zavarzinella formosa]
MSPTFGELGINQLSAAQRIALALEIWETLGDERPAGQLTPRQRAELNRRDAELDVHPEKALTWEQIRTAVENRQ